MNPFRDFPVAESDARAASGEPFVIRFKVPAEGKTQFEDAVFGTQERDYHDIEDLVLLRSDGHPLYNLSVVCDDIAMGITHVIRGQDHLSNTHKQVLIYLSGVGSDGSCVCAPAADSRAEQGQAL